MTVTQAALDLGISYSRLHSWISQAKSAKLTGRPAFAWKGKSTLSEQEKRIKELEKEVAILWNPVTPVRCSQGSAKWGQLLYLRLKVF